MEKPRLILRSNGSTFNQSMAEKYGNNWGKCKISDEHVHEIRRRYATGSISQKQLAEHYKISRGHVSKIIRAAVWKHTHEQTNSRSSGTP
jgi:predicted XRE-type DNA-binding protein